MRGVRRTESGIETLELAAPVGEGVRVRTRSVSICQTDINLARMGALPFTPGHEFAGLLDDGTPVGIEPIDPCGGCTYCARGDYHFCERGHSMVIGVGREGGMAEEVLVPARSIVPLPTGLDVSKACLIEPLAVNLHSLDLARLEGRHRVCVVGAGMTGFGLLGAAGARYRGCEVALEESASHALEAAERLGIDPRPDGLYDIVIEGDGSEDSIAAAAERCAPGGTLLLVAGYYSDKMFKTLPCIAKELHMIWGTYYGHHAAGRDVDNAAAILAQTPAIAETLITHRYPIEAAREAFELVESETPSLKVVLEP